MRVTLNKFKIKQVVNWSADKNANAYVLFGTGDGIKGRWIAVADFIKVGAKFRKRLSCMLFNKQRERHPKDELKLVLHDESGNKVDMPKELTRYVAGFSGDAESINHFKNAWTLAEGQYCVFTDESDGRGEQMNTWGGSILTDRSRLIDEWNAANNGFKTSESAPRMNEQTPKEAAPAPTPPAAGLAEITAQDEKIRSVAYKVDALENKLSNMSDQFREFAKTQGEATAKTMQAVSQLIDEQKAINKRIDSLAPIIVHINGAEAGKVAGLKHNKLELVIKASLACGGKGGVLLVGGAGSGKSFIAEQVAEALKTKFYFQGAVDSEFKLLGYRDAKGDYHDTPFRRAYEHGGVFLFDELDASSAEALLAFNAGIASGAMDFPDGIVQKHKDFRCIATANTFGHGATRQYMGRSALDGATLDRFMTIEIDYCESLEVAISNNEAWLKLVWEARKAAQGECAIISTRAIEQGQALLHAGVSEGDVVELALFKGMDESTRGVITSRMLDGGNCQNVAARYRHIRSELTATKATATA